MYEEQVYYIILSCIQLGYYYWYASATLLMTVYIVGLILCCYFLGYYITISRSYHCHAFGSAVVQPT